MSIINKEISDFKAYAFHENEFKTVSKDDILGKWSVFFFYPADFTFICPTELEDLENKYEEFRNAEEPFRKVQACQFVYAHGDQVCPANWQPGSETLKPSLDLVGQL